jgi:hypothetical protein
MERARVRWVAARALAIAIHAVVLGLLPLLGATGRRVAAVPVAPPSAAELVEVELAQSPESGDEARPELAAREVRGVPARRSTSGVASEKTPAPSSGASTGDEPAPTEGAPYTLDPRAREAPRVNLAIGEGDWSRWALAEGAPPTSTEERATPSRVRPPRPASTTGGLAEALEAHDREVGLGPAGSVLTAARDAAHTEIAPQLGRAVFGITVLSSGHVQVELMRASGEVAAWKNVGATMQAALARKPPAIPGARNGVLLELELTAQERWPNGAAAKSEGPTLAVTPPKFQGVDEAHEDLARRNPLAVDPVPTPNDRPPLRLNVDLPGVFLKGRGKVCGYQIGITPFGLGFSGGCDPSNIGAKPIRVVSTRILRETML